ncbi:DUF6950 family protein [Hyphococcus sp.]|uniref:DUF6950 family protein n=1 Tax=Hyphococcus sp. TaxID=2038636 RepID=UPI0020885E39|nr:MAG: hypothetical protein DHS20C04_30780 [Marinicaulis sp.]
MTKRFQRVADWPRLLNEHIMQSQAAYLEGGLRWGEFDCCTFAFDWVARITDLDPMAEYRGRYETREEAIRALWGHGDKTLFGALVRVFGDPVSPAQAQRGDIAFRDDEGGAIGIIHTIGARQIGIFLGDDGFTIVEVKNIDHAFIV